jgi:hypothetical protein
MRITVDTTEDSADDIERAIKFLQTFIDEPTETPRGDDEGMFNMFGDDEPTPSSDDEDAEDVEVVPYDL